MDDAITWTVAPFEEGGRHGGALDFDGLYSTLVAAAYATDDAPSDLPIDPAIVDAQALVGVFRRHVADAARLKAELAHLDEADGKSKELCEFAESARARLATCAQYADASACEMAQLSELAAPFFGLVATLSARSAEARRRRRCDVEAELAACESNTCAFRRVMASCFCAWRRDDAPSADETADGERNTCPICFQRSVQVCAAPCGHTFCNTCATLVERRPRCAMCRAPVDAWIKLHFSC